MTRRITKPAPKRSPEEWARLVRAWKKSGQSGRSFAAVRGISAATLAWWAWRLRRSGRTRQHLKREQSPGLRLIELAVDRGPVSPPSAGWELITPAGVQLKVQGELSAEALALVLGAGERR